MDTSKALVKISQYNEALWIYFDGRIQCFKCGWWNKKNDKVSKERAIELWESHQCEEGRYDTRRSR